MSISNNGGYTATYRNMVGVDFSMGSASPSKRRYAYAENMYRDYENGDAALLESVPGFRKIISLGGRTHAIYSHKNENGEEYAVIHCSNKLYRFKVSERDKLTSLSPIATIADVESSAFRFGSDLYILDGKEITKISGAGSVSKINAENDSVYVPTTFYNGERIEQKNLLTDRFREKYVIGAAETVIYGTPGLMYKVTDASLGLCAVEGVSSSFAGILNIPSYATIGNKRYKVDEISDNAFLNNENIRGVKLGIGLWRIGKFAFSGCKTLTSVWAYNAPRFIDDFAFKDCSALNTFFLGAEIEKFGDSVFSGCTSLNDIRYASDEKNFKKIENSDSLSEFGIYGFQNDFSLILEIPIKTPLSEIISVTLDGKEIGEYSTVAVGEGKSSVIFPINDVREAEGKEVVIYARSLPDISDGADGANDFLSDYGFAGSGFDAICGCRVCESFDGRIFLSGNPLLPGVVFFSSREAEKKSPLYFGSYNYFCDGFGVFGVTSMLSSENALLVFKSADDGGGSIFYHSPKETDISFMPKIYPTVSTHNGIGAIGKSFSFFDDPLFLSKMGVSAIDKKTISLERSIACRSDNVNARLLSEDLRTASLAEWCGYLALGVNGKIFLADSREIFTHSSGYKEYEWYYMNEIGTWESDLRVYRYSSYAREGFLVHNQPESEVYFTVYSVLVDNKTVYYTVEGDKKYEVYPTDERAGGVFHPLVCLSSFEGDLLFFGTDNGDICIFNNDKRGIAPEHISSDYDFKEEDYRRYYGRRIHPYFYTFDTHRMRSGVHTAPYDCSRPDLTKNTVKHSLTLKCRLSGSGKIRCEVKTNRSGYTERSAFPNSVPDFSDLCFSSLTLDCEETVSLPISEKEKNWIDKEIAVYCDDFRSPIGIYSISYRYTPKGRIKHT